MPSWIECSADPNHCTNIPIREAASCLSEGRALPTCRVCDRPLRYIVSHKYAEGGPDAQTRQFEVARVARLSGDGHFFLLDLLELPSGAEGGVLPIFWAPDRKGRIRYGQFSPFLTLAEWKDLFRKIEQSRETQA
jgi:hypothetical protein